MSDEDVSEFAYRLREKATIAFSDIDVSEENCLLAFMRGVKNAHIKRKLNESDVENFNEALKLAKKLEKVENMLNKGETPEVTSILKETSVSFKPSRGTERSSFRSDSSSNRERSRSRSYRGRRQFSRSRTPNRSRGRSIAKVCWFCQKPGHIQRFCWSRQQIDPQRWRGNARNRSEFQHQSNGFRAENSSSNRPSYSHGLYTVQ